MTTIIRPGQRIVNIPGIGLSVSRRCGEAGPSTNGTRTYGECGAEREMRMAMRTLLLIVAILSVLAAPVSAGSSGPVAPDVAEINFFHYDECENVFWWQTDSEVNIWAFRLEHPAAGWVGERLNAANYPSVHGMTYAIYGPMHADLAGDYWLRVFFDNGTSRMEDMAERVCEWQPKSLQTRLTDVAK